MQAVVLCGGKGTRMLGELGEDLPKMLTPLPDKLGSTLIENLLQTLTRNQFTSVLFICGHNSRPIIDIIRVVSSRYNIMIETFVESHPSGPANALNIVTDQIMDAFLLIMGDLLITADLKRFWDFSVDNKCDLGLVVKCTDHPEDSDLVEVNDDWTVKKFHLRLPDRSQPARPNFPLGNSGVFYIKKKLLKEFNASHGDIHETLVKRACDSIQYKCNAYFTAEFIKDIGSPNRWKAIWNNEIIDNIYSSSREFKSGAVFVDKDDTLVKDELSKLPARFDFIDKTIANITESGLQKIIIISNQPAIAKGFVTENECFDYFGKLCCLLLDKYQIKIDGFYYCPHHPEGGHKGEIEHLKIKCDCRKPSRALLDRAVECHNVDIKKSIFIGDSDNDRLLAESVNIPYIHID